MPVVFYESRHYLRTLRWRKIPQRPTRWRYFDDKDEEQEFYLNLQKTGYEVYLSYTIPDYPSPTYRREPKPPTEPKPRIERQWVPLPSNLRKNKNATET